MLNENLSRWDLKAVLTTDTGMCRRPLVSSSSCHASVSRQSSSSTASSSSVLATKAAPGETNHRPGTCEASFHFSVSVCLPLLWWICILIFKSNWLLILDVPCCVQSRPFSPPVSGSPPPFAPLARAESSSSISSITLQSAASTPTLGRELNMSTAGTASHLLIFVYFSLASHLSLCPCCLSLIIVSVPHSLVPLHDSLLLMSLLTQRPPSLWYGLTTAGFI